MLYWRKDERIVRGRQMIAAKGHHGNIFVVFLEINHVVSVVASR